MPHARTVARALALTLAALVVLAGAGVAFVSWRSADELVHPEREVSSWTPENVGLAYERVAFDSADGIPLAGWWMPAGEASNGTVVVLHGYGMSKNQSLALAPFLHEAGYHVLAFDFRAHGESGGAHTTVGLDEVADVQGAVRWLQDRLDADAERLALLGFSMGAATAINVASKIPSLDAVVADSSFASLENIASNSITHFTGLPKYPFGPLAVFFAGMMVDRDVSTNVPAHAIREVEAPVLVIQGEADTIAYPVEDGEAIFASASVGSAFWLVPGATHVDAHSTAQEDYESRVVAFLETHLAAT